MRGTVAHKELDMRRSLAAAIAATLGIAAVPAHAVLLDPRGTGQVLIYPYYTVNAGNGTLLSIVNTTVHGKALKVRFHEGRNGRVVFAFNLYLSPYDVWVGQTFDTSADGSGGAAIATNDNSCTVPALAPAPGNPGVRIAPFGNAAYSGPNSDGGPAGLDRTREGLVEVIEMGEIGDGMPGTMHTLRAISHVAGTPLSCAQVVSAWAANGYWATNAAIDMTPPGGGLFGAASIINVAQGTLFPVAAEIIDGFSSAFQHTAPDAATPDLNTAGKSQDGLVSASVPVNGRTLQLNFAQGEDAVSALFMADGLYNEYLVDPALGAQTDWVLSFPTKRFYADPARVGTVARAPFNALFGADATLPGTACSTLATQVVSREEDVPVGSVLDQPQPAHASVCFETSVLTLAGTDSTLGSRLLVATGAASSAIPDVRYSGGQIQLDLSGPAHALVSSTGDALLGLPAIGFAVTNYVNANVMPGVLSNYSAAYPHHQRAACTDPIGRSCSGGTGGAVTFSPLNPAPAPLAISPNPINAGTGTGSIATVTYRAVYASACSVSSSGGTPSPTGSGACPPVSLGNIACSGSGSPLNCSGNGTVTEPMPLSGPASCSYTLTATCNPGGVTSSANLSVVPSGGGGDNIPSACQNLVALGTGTAGQFWSRVLTTKVRFGDGATASDVDATSYVAVWNYPGATVPWPGNFGLTTRPSALINQYFAEKFIVPTNGSVTGHPNWVYSGSGINSNMSMSISVCPGDFGQTGTQLTTGCLVPMSKSSSGLTAAVSPTQLGTYCSLVPGRAYYLNILPMASLPSNNVSASSCTTTCTPWLGVVQ